MPEPVENDSPEMSFRRGYQHGVIDVFRAIERLLDPASRGHGSACRSNHQRHWTSGRDKQ
jgi:hypothetical protein